MANDTQIIVITGPMFSGKSGELINTCKNISLYGNKKVIMIKPQQDTRWEEGKIISRIGMEMEAFTIPSVITEKNFDMLFDMLKDYDVIGFDEANFFDGLIVVLIQKLFRIGKTVYVAGLDTDYTGFAFGKMGDIMAISTQVIKKVAYCACCGKIARFNQRLVNGAPAPLGETILIGDTEQYKPVCAECFIPPYVVQQALYGETKDNDEDEA